MAPKSMTAGQHPATQCGRVTSCRVYNLELIATVKILWEAFLPPKWLCIILILCWFTFRQYHNVLYPTPDNSRSQHPNSFQLMVCFKAFGDEGSRLSAGNLREEFATGYGISIVYICLCSSNLQSKRQVPVFTWWGWKNWIHSRSSALVGYPIALV